MVNLSSLVERTRAKHQEALGSNPTPPLPGCATFNSDSTTLGLVFLVRMITMGRYRAIERLWKMLGAQ